MRVRGLVSLGLPGRAVGVALAVVCLVGALRPHTGVIVWGFFALPGRPLAAACRVAVALSGRAYPLN